MRRAVLLTIVASLGPAFALAQSERSPMRHVRSTQERLERLLDEGSRRSPTFAGLRVALESSDVIVYLLTVSHLPAAVDGRLLFLHAAQGYRYLRIEVRRTLNVTELLATIGHELQHALEVADASEVRDVRTLADYYRRVGLDSAGHTKFDTAAARLTGRRVRAELLGA